MAELNLSYNTNKDVYSDGSIEEDILNIVRGKAEISDYYNQYPVLYHLSPARENILAWYPFKQNASCLEVGAGCGAVTGGLCRRLKTVVSVDISERRCLINYERHKDCDNLEIIAGNIHDIDFKNKFDYIVLNGVFEYAMSFTHTDREPYREFLSSLSKLLSKNGHILMAIENRLGLKYFSGSPEDHTDEYFLGLNSYENNKSVRTFTKKELTDIISESGYKRCKFYYPYPDYKFASEIFTDETLEEFKYGRPVYNLKHNSFYLFNEQKVLNTLYGEKITDRFVNSFFVDICRKNEFPNVVYAKINSERNKKFRICTVITEGRSGRRVEKFPLTEEAGEHIENIYKNSEYSLIRGVSNGSLGRKPEGGIFYKFHNRRNMDDVLKEYIDSGRFEDVFETIELFFKPFKEAAEICEYENDKFREIFGSERYEGELSCLKPANIDMIFDNIIIGDSGFIIIDTEWIFDTAVPVLFIIWRAVRELYAKYENLTEALSFGEMIGKFGIDDKMSSVFLSWALHFAEEYVGGGLISKFSVDKKYLNLSTAYGLLYNQAECSLYTDTGEGFTEEGKLSTFLNVRNDGSFSVIFYLPENCRGLRFDPEEGRLCRCSIDYINGRASAVNAVKKEEGFDVFENTDPQYEIFTDERRLVIKGRIFISDIRETSQTLENRLHSAKDELCLADERFSAARRDYESVISGKDSEINDLNTKLNRRICISEKNQAFLLERISGLSERAREYENKYNEVIGSKGWRLLDRLREIMIFFRRKA